MITDKRRAANKCNAQNSTGPTSDEGKAASRMNALKSGLYAKSAVIRGESAEEFDEIVQQYDDQYHPGTPQARALVDSLIRNTWLLRRYDRIEGELWESRFDKIDDFRYSDKSHPTALAFGMMSSDHDRLRKYAEAAERSLVRTLNKLDKLTEHEPDPVVQALVPAAPEPVPAQSEPAAVPQPVDPEPATPENGFVPADRSEPVVGGPRPLLKQASDRRIL